jgi:hypothetical protein
MMDNLKRLAMAGFAMEATERNPTFVEEFVEQVPKKNQQVTPIHLDRWQVTGGK